MVALVSCSNEPDPVVVSNAPLAPPLSTDATPTVAPAISTGDQTQAGLEATLAEQYTHIQQGDWAGVYGYMSPRCKNMYTQDQVVADLDAGYEGRDFSGPQQYLITMNSPELATVVIKSFDNKGKMQPTTWSYINGVWFNDAC